MKRISIFLFFCLVSLRGLSQDPGEIYLGKENNKKDLYVSYTYNISNPIGSRLSLLDSKNRYLFSFGFSFGFDKEGHAYPTSNVSYQRDTHLKDIHTQDQFRRSLSLDLGYCFKKTSRARYYISYGKAYNSISTNCISWHLYQKPSGDIYARKGSYLPEGTSNFSSKLSIEKFSGTFNSSISIYTDRSGSGPEKFDFSIGIPITRIFY